MSSVLNLYFDEGLLLLSDMQVVWICKVDWSWFCDAYTERRSEWEREGTSRGDGTREPRRYIDTNDFKVLVLQMHSITSLLI